MVIKEFFFLCEKINYPCPVRFISQACKFVLHLMCLCINHLVEIVFPYVVVLCSVSFNIYLPFIRIGYSSAALFKLTK